MVKLATQANTLVLVAFALVLGLVGFLYLRYGADLASADYWVRHSYLVLGEVKDLMIAVDEAETGQRGFLLTGRSDYLAPYAAARDRATLMFSDLRQQTADNPDEQRRLEQLSPLVQQKLEELAQTIELRRTAGAAAMALVDTDRGKDLMSGIRDIVREMTAAEQRLLENRLKSAAAARDTTNLLIWLGAVTALLLFAVAAAMLRVSARRQALAEAAARAAADRLRLSFDNLSQGIAVFDAAWRLTAWNHCFVALLALPPALAAAGTNYRDVVEALGNDGEFLENEAQITDSVPQNGNQPVIYERTRRSGQTFELRRTPMPDGGFVITVSDITARIRAERMQRESQRMQTLGKLTGGVAHDFNNLLTVIGGNLELLQNRFADAEAGQRLSAAMRGVERGASLTRHLLAFGRRQALEPRTIDLNRLLAEMSSGMLRRVLGEQIDLQVVEGIGLWPAFADPAQIENAILNLALNARDAMPEGGKLTLETANATLDQRYAQMNEEVEPGQYAMIAVSDTGTGMTPDIIAHAFEPFFSTKEEGKGSGLGLAMVHGFVKQSKGHVKIYSEPGHGTSIRIYLPRSTAAALDEPLAPVEMPHGSATILVVEDDPEVRCVAVAQLGELGYRVIEAGDAASGLKVFNGTEAIDLLLTDVVLPGSLRGRDLADLVRRASPRTKILFMSGYTENAIVHDGRLDSDAILLMKPFRREELAKKVAQALSVEPPAGEGNIVSLRDKTRGR